MSESRSGFSRNRRQARHCFNSYRFSTGPVVSYAGIGSFINFAFFLDWLSTHPKIFDIGKPSRGMVQQNQHKRIGEANVNVKWIEETKTTSVLRVPG